MERLQAEKYKGFGNSQKKPSQEIHSLVPSSTFSPEISEWCWSFRSICASPLAQLMSPRARRQSVGTVLCRMTQVASRGKSRVFYTSHALWRRLCRVICGFNCRGAPGTVRRRQNCAARSAPEGPGSLGVARVGGFCAKCVNKLSQRIKLVGDKWMWCIGKVPLWLFFFWRGYNALEMSWLSLERKTKVAGEAGEEPDKMIDHTRSH